MALRTQRVQLAQEDFVCLRCSLRLEEACAPQNERALRPIDFRVRSAKLGA
jgi:hypothetical protein